MLAEWAPSAASRRRVPLTAVHGACQTRPSPSPPFCFVSNGLPPGLAEGVDQVVLWVESFLPVARAISRRLPELTSAAAAIISFQLSLAVRRFHRANDHGKPSCRFWSRGCRKLVFLRLGPLR